MEDDVPAAPAQWHDDGRTSVSVSIINRQEPYFYAKRFGTVDDEHDRRWFTHEEAFYLMNCGKLDLLGWSLQDAWDAMGSKDPSFTLRYVAYSHFRDNGWIVQSGLLYGVAYSLYRMSPDVVHSEFMVYLHDTSIDKSLSWHVIQALTRVAEDIKKTVLLCTIDRMENDSAPGVISPIAGEYFTLHTMQFRHWNCQFHQNATTYDMAESVAIPKRS